ncbi:MAG: hypothetical protein HY675_14510 [Chloroflexi bacterium]|nr:hypothetical protein [Chloroflexota bacterium]
MFLDLPLLTLLTQGAMCAPESLYQNFRRRRSGIAVIRRFDYIRDEMGRGDGSNKKKVNPPKWAVMAQRFYDQATADLEAARASVRPRLYYVAVFFIGASRGEGREGRVLASYGRGAKVDAPDR